MPQIMNTEVWFLFWAVTSNAAIWMPMGFSWFFHSKLMVCRVDVKQCFWNSKGQRKLLFQVLQWRCPCSVPIIQSLCSSSSSSVPKGCQFVTHHSAFPLQSLRGNSLGVLHLCRTWRGELLISFLYHATASLLQIKGDLYKGCISVTFERKIKKCLPTYLNLWKGN